MWRVVGALALGSGCLLAPARPDDIGGGECTMPSESADFPVVGVFPRGEADMLVRAGIDGGAARVNFYDPSPTFSPSCATRSVELPTVDMRAVKKVLALGRMTDQFLLVLVERNDDLPAVYQIDILEDPPVLTQSVVTGSVPIRPVRGLASPFVGYSALANELWFGGPEIQRTALGVMFGGTTSVATVTGHAAEGWYLAVGADGIADYPFVLIGQRADYGAAKMTDVTIQASNEGPRDPAPATCDASLTTCADRIARAVTTGPSSLSRVPAFSFTQESSITAIYVEGSLSPMSRTLFTDNERVLEDVALHELGTAGSAQSVDAIVLTANTATGRRTLSWYADAFTVMTSDPNAAEELASEAVPGRVVVGTFVPDEAPKVLVLDPHPGLAGAADRCFTLVDQSLVDCALPAP